jgi:hypothetical protein
MLAQTKHNYSTEDDLCPLADSSSTHSRAGSIPKQQGPPSGGPSVFLVTRQRAQVLPL